MLQEDSPIPLLGQAVWLNGRYIIKEHAYAGEPCCWLCPKCRKVYTETPSEPGVMRHRCNVCNAITYITVDGKSSPNSDSEETELVRTQKAQSSQPSQSSPSSQKSQPSYPSQPPQPPQPTLQIGELSEAVLRWGGPFRHKTEPLRVGCNIVGRNDPKALSDINIDDDEVSRRSVRIDVDFYNGLYSYRLTVLRATNPVIVNGVTVLPNQTVDIHYGQNIVLGQTTIKFKKS